METIPSFKAMDRILSLSRNHQLLLDKENTPVSDSVGELGGRDKKRSSALEEGVVSTSSYAFLKCWCRIEDDE